MTDNSNNVLNLDLASAALLARRGRFQEAEHRLQSGDGSSGASVLDLRARISAQRGDFDGAHTLWQQARELTESDNAYAEQLEALARARARDRVRWLSRAPVIGAIVLFMTAMVFWFIVSKSIDTATTIESSVANQATVIQALSAEIATLKDARDKPASVQTAVDNPDGVDHKLVTIKTLAALSSVRGTSVAILNDDRIQIVFDQGLFSKWLSISDSAGASIRDIAAALKSLPQDSHIEIVGHTDSRLIKVGNAFETNHDLGIARASAVAAVLDQYGISTDRLTLSAKVADDSNAAENSVEQQSLQRTVQLIVMRRSGS